MKRKAAVSSLVLIAHLLVCICALPQERDRQRPVRGDSPPNRVSQTSELAKDNLDRVAASVAQLKVILLQDIGLLVELKRWMANEASNNGQVVADEDLTDAAVFERLASDVKF